MRDRWDDADAARWQGDIGLRVYTSRLLGADADLVLHGGGNTSVKVRRADVFGDEVDVLVVKGSGTDMADIDASGFALLRLDHVARLATLSSLSDTEMAGQLRVASIVAGGPAPSVEAILHAVLPHRYIDHTHADAVVTLTNTPVAADLLAEAYGDDVVVVPYVMPGFQLAKAVAAQALPPAALGMVLMNHGIFTWGDSARESYGRMLDLVSRAESIIATRRRVRERVAVPLVHYRTGPGLRAAVSAAAGAPMIVSTSGEVDVRAFRSLYGDEVTQRGTATPEHVIRTKPWPMVGDDVGAYVARYRAYFDRHATGEPRGLQPLDPAPRVILHAPGLSCAGRTAKDARVAEDVYRHTMKVMADAEDLGGYRPIGEADLFDVEYWELEQVKLRRADVQPPFAGEIALVTGAASGIGRACARALLDHGAAVVGLDRNAEVKSAFDGVAVLGLECDVTDEEAVAAAIDQTVERFGGLDILVLNAGIFSPDAPLAELDLGQWRRVMAVNVDANAALLRAAHPCLRLAPRGGRVVVIGSKNVPAPGPGAAPYSASKAAVTQLARVAALEWGGDGIRVNVIHPDAVFDTAIWSDEVLAERAAHYGMTVDEYRNKNVLGTEVTSDDVARMCVAMCGPAFAKTTAAQVPVDGGNDRVI